MKSKISRSIVFLITFMMCLSMQAISVYAKEQDGIDVQITTDKRAYQKGENVQFTVDIKNQNNYPVTNVKVQNKLQEGLIFEAEADAAKNIDNIGSGEEKSFTFNAKLKDEIKNPQTQGGGNSENPPSQGSGDNENNVTMDSSSIYIFALVIIAAAIVMSISFKGKKGSIKKISLILCILLSSQFLISSGHANAAQTETSKANDNNVTFSSEKSISVGEDTLKYQADVTFQYENKKNDDIVVNKPELKDDEDADNDGLKNGEEKKYGTDPYKKDTDNDGLSDYDEIYKFKTDPLNEDSDGDGVLDGEEVSLELNPLNKKSDGTNIDGQRTHEKQINSQDNTVSVLVKGNSSIVSTTIDNKDMAAFNSFSGLYSGVKEFHCNDKFDSAIITFNYSDDELLKKNMKAEDLSIFYFNEDTKAFEKVPSTVNTTAKTVSASVTHFSSYALADSTKLGNYDGTLIRLLIDNSGSMYPKALCSDSNENDTDFKRVDFANALIDRFASDKKGKYQFSASKFTKDYLELCPMTNDYDKLKKSITSIKTATETFNGTYIGTSMDKELSNFNASDCNHKKYIILLTDGETTEGTGVLGMFDDYKTADEIKQEALEKGVVVFAVGLGNSVDKSYLMKMSKETGGDYFIASDANALQEIYNKIASSIEYNEIDTDNDNKTDSIMMADSQFDVKKDGFSFENGRINNTADDGFCYGMAEFAERYYTKTLPLSLSSVDINNYATLIGHVFCGQSDWESVGYDLKDDQFFGKMKDVDAKKPYDYVPKVYNYQFQSGLRSADKPYNFTSEGRSMLENSGFVIKKSGDNEFPYLDINSDKFVKSTNNTEVQLFRALNRLYVSQRFLKNINDTISIDKKPDETLNTVKGLLQNKVPANIGIGGHSVNAIRMLRDKKNPNLIKLYIYDNNYPGKENIMHITRKKLIDSDKNESYDYDVKYSTDDYTMNKLEVNVNKILE